MSLSVVIADDSATARMIIQRCCEIAGLENATYFQAANGKRAIEIIGDNIVDLVLTDMNMPEMDGRELLEHVQRDPMTNHIPVIVITSLQNEALAADLKTIGAAAVLPKPLTPALLAKELTKIKW